MQSTPEQSGLFAQGSKAGQDYVARKLWEIAETEASDASGSELKYPSKLRALELLGKLCGSFQTRQGPQPSLREENNLLELLDSIPEVNADDLPEVL